MAKKAKCYNCKHKGNTFKIGKLTHTHCEDPRQYSQEGWDNDEFDAWETLRVFSDTCDKHEFQKK